MVTLLSNDDNYSHVLRPKYWWSQPITDGGWRETQHVANLRVLQNTRTDTSLDLLTCDEQVIQNTPLHVVRVEHLNRVTKRFAEIDSPYDIANAVRSEPSERRGSDFTRISTRLYSASAVTVSMGGRTATCSFKRLHSTCVVLQRVRAKENGRRKAKLANSRRTCNANTSHEKWFSAEMIAS